jgi:hypothetical protein
MIVPRNLLALFVLTAVVLPLSGCGGEQLPPGMPPPVPTEIIVMQGGSPLSGAVVRLHPVDGSPWTAGGRTDASGTAVVITADRFRGAVPGKYKITVSKTESPQPGAPLPSGETDGVATSPASYNLVEAQFGLVSTTTLEIEVSRGTPTHTVDVGTAVRIRIDEGR